MLNRPEENQKKKIIIITLAYNLDMMNGIQEIDS